MTAATQRKQSMNSPENTVVLPCHAGTLVARTAQNDGADVDGICIELLRTDGTKDEVALIVSTEEGLSFSVSIPMKDLNTSITPEVTFPI